MTARVLVTGATGFVGSVLCDTLASAGYIVRAAVRSDRALPPAIAEKAVVGEIDQSTDWSAALTEVDFVVHLAARVHIMHDGASNAQLYELTNALGTLQLATCAARSGIRRLIYLSSIKVNGEERSDGVYSAADVPMPSDSYGKSKLHGEQHLSVVSAREALDYAAVRPPLVYGPGVRANFLKLMRWVDRELPLPLAAVANRRSLVSVWNLSDLILRLLREPKLSQRTWLVSDGEDLATPELIRRLARAMNRRARLVPMPPALLRLGGALVGKGPEVSRLCGSLQVDSTATERELGWRPPVSIDEGLARTVRWYLDKGRQ